MDFKNRNPPTAGKVIGYTEGLKAGYEGGLEDYAEAKTDVDAEWEAGFNFGWDVAVEEKAA